MKKIKLKKKARNTLVIGVVVILILFIAINKGISIYKEKQYQKTYEYKLINIGYTKEDATLLQKKLADKNIDYILSIDKDEDLISIIKETYFIKDNFQKYIDFKKNSKETNSRKIVEKVNTMRDNDFYTNSIPTDINKKELMLVNKYHYLDNTYEPENLVTIPQSYSWGEKGSQKCAKVTYDAFMDMWHAANEQGYYLMVNSSYRDYEKQQNIYEDYKTHYGTTYADNYAAHPGYSEHQTGYALDIVDKNYTSRNSFTSSDAFKWTQDNAHKYGFILRYQEKDEDITGTKFESWHYRYVGLDTAKYIYENDITFDEYYAVFVNN